MRNMRVSKMGTIVTLLRGEFLSKGVIKIRMPFLNVFKDSESYNRWKVTKIPFRNFLENFIGPLGNPKTL